jgi:hypothetical protein
VVNLTWGSNFLKDTILDISSMHDLAGSTVIHSTGGWALAALQLKEYEVITDKERKGWVCPVCGRVYAPSVSECTECNKNREST